ncbi:MAG: PKD domain-containing protein [Bacteroidetes bacterium]|nr:PKD domain-containing protein [Bacteroidota bacterium]
MKALKTILAFVFFLLLMFESKATHIVGGEIYYTSQGNNNYLITLKLYRDCINGQAPYDTLAAIGIFNSSNTLVDSILIPYQFNSINVPSVLNYPCVKSTSNVCVEEAIYTATINLPPIAGGYNIVYQRCCRNNTISNLSSPGSTGATYQITIPDTSLGINSSAYYNSFPPIYLCAGKPFSFDHEATDPDGDSLAYELCNPFDGANSYTPMPQPPFNPPYSSVSYVGGYSAIKPFGASSAFSINPQTGLIAGTPNNTGQYVIAVCVKEYRNGNLLCINKRDFQFNVVSCAPTKVISIQAQQTFCSGLTINFFSTSTNITKYHWDFGDVNLTNDTSHFVNPSYTYNNPGTYTVTLTGDQFDSCSVTTKKTFKVYPLFSPTLTAPAPQCLTGNSFGFSIAGPVQGAPTTDYSWNFGTSATPASSTADSPGGVSYSSTGNKIVKVTLSENGCTKVLTKTVTINPMATADFKMKKLKGCAPFTVNFVDTTNASGNILNYHWNFGDGDSSQLSSVAHTYVPGIYNASLQILATNNFGCNKVFDFKLDSLITVFKMPTASVTATPLFTNMVEPDITFTDLSSNGTNCLLDFGDGTSINVCDFLSEKHSYTEAGIYRARQIVMTDSICSDTSDVTIEVDSDYVLYVPNAFTPNNNGQNEVFAPKISGVVNNYIFRIFDRWGNKVFETTNTTDGWNGYYNNRLCQIDTYIYKIDFNNALTNKSKTVMGCVSLLR